MKVKALAQLYLRTQSLAVFRALLADPVVDALVTYLNISQFMGAEDAVGQYGEFVSRLYASGCPSLALHIQTLVEESENAYVCTLGRGEEPWPEMEEAVSQELQTLQALADLTPQLLREGLDWKGYLPGFRAEKVDIALSYRARCKNIGKYGYGIYARHRMFYIDPENKIVPVHNPDRIQLSSLVDYKREQQIILRNTLALLDGKPASNILLTGDAGTGKSSTVKAVGNELYQQGLRILEVRREQLHLLPGILDTLALNPLKFILFIDDLSFQNDDANFSALKAILEGSVSAKSGNVVIYATSNRRHLIRESFSNREGDDVHRNDTMQELISLSERFGIHVTFSKPDKNTYLHIVQQLAQEKGLPHSDEELARLAEQYALSRGGRSARAAAQFVDNLLSST